MTNQFTMLQDRLKPEQNQTVTKRPPSHKKIAYSVFEDAIEALGISANAWATSNGYGSGASSHWMRDGTVPEVVARLAQAQVRVAQLEQKSVRKLYVIQASEDVIWLLKQSTEVFLTEIK